MSGQLIPEKFCEWLVFRNGVVIEKVFYLSDMTSEDVKRSLIDHGGFPPDVNIIKGEIL